jgi:hypothetical protein
MVWWERKTPNFNRRESLKPHISDAEYREHLVRKDAIQRIVVVEKSDILKDVKDKHKAVRANLTFENRGPLKGI